MATEDECAAAFDELAKRLANAHPDARKKAAFDRTLSCRLSDLGVIFGGRLHDGGLSDIRKVERADAQVKMTMTSDDLIALVDGSLKMSTAWTRGRSRSTRACWIWSGCAESSEILAGASAQRSGR